MSTPYYQNKGAKAFVTPDEPESPLARENAAGWEHRMGGKWVGC